MSEVDTNEAVHQLVTEYAHKRLGRRDFVKRAAALGVSVPAAAALLASAGARPGAVMAQDAPQPGGRFTWGYDRDFTKMDPVASGWADPGYNALYEYTMIRHPETGLPVPMLAESLGGLGGRTHLATEPPRRHHVSLRGAGDRRDRRGELQRLPRRGTGPERDLLGHGDRRHRRGQHGRRYLVTAIRRPSRDACDRVLDDLQPGGPRGGWRSVRRHL